MSENQERDDELFERLQSEPDETLEELNKLDIWDPADRARFAQTEKQLKTAIDQGPRVRRENEVAAIREASEKVLGQEGLRDGDLARGYGALAMARGLKEEFPNANVAALFEDLLQEETETNMLRRQASLRAVLLERSGWTPDRDDQGRLQVPARRNYDAEARQLVKEVQAFDPWNPRDQERFMQEEGRLDRRLREINEKRRGR